MTAESRVGVEIGGTFTDLVWLKPDGALATCKVPSTPASIHQAVLDAIAEAGIDLAAVRHVVHGSTVATNALLTRRGVPTGLLTTKGFRDVIEIGTHDRVGSVYQIFYRKPAAPIPRRLIGEVDERVDASGRVLRPLDVEEGWRAAERLIAAGARSIAICLLHSYVNPAHETALAAEIRRRAPEVTVTASAEISPEFREFERTMTTAVNAFVSPVVDRYVRRLDERLGADGYGGVLQIMQSSGGVMPGEAAGRNAVRMLLSGPAAGVRGAIWFARRNGIADIVTIDMGGTSTDVAIAPGCEPRMTHELVVDDLPIRSPAVDMVTVGAGGGSIAHLDAGGFLAVGPDSAGAQPGPACYGRGGERATVTDAQVVAGLLRPARFFGGKMALQVDRAEAALAAIGVEGSLAEVSDGVLRTVNNNMASAVRLVSTARGIDPRGFVLVAYGGGGPLHGAMVADEIGIGRVLVPWSPGLISAFGLLVADLSIDLVRTRFQVLSDATLGPDAVAELAAAAATAAAAHGLEPGSWVAEYGLDLRYAGQAYELTLWFDALPADAARIAAAFQIEHRRRYGYARDSLTVEAVNYRTRIVQKVGGAASPPPPPEGPPPAAETAVVRFNGKVETTAFLPRVALPAGFRLIGPAVIEEATATTVVPPGWSARVLPTGDLLLEKGEGR
ncbi:MAG: hydantoinase/oxoprolinase family protein [Alphaproteobacteria bacterium]|nr:hydantoinase/oxoprolinase family protein [Alphaproteobacteria bacterium]